jgi:hypothetical protein
MAEPLTGVLGADFSAFVTEAAKANAALTTLVTSSSKMEDALAKLTTATEENHSSWAKNISEYISSEAIIKAVSEAFGTLTQFVGDSMGAAVESEEANSRLLAALQAQGTAMPSVVDAYNQYATQLQNTTTYSDDAARAAETMLAMIGGVMPRDMKAALAASADLASGLKIDLTDAAMMVSKALEGNEGALKKAGIAFDDTKGHVVSFDEIIGKVNDQFGGQAAAAVDTYAGHLAQLENSWSSLQGAVGRLITENNTVRTAIGLVTGAITENTSELTANKTANEFVSDAVILTAKAFDVALAGVQLLIAGYEKIVIAGNALGVAMFSVAATVMDTLTGIREGLSYVNPADYFNPEQYAADIAQLSGAADFFRGRVEDLNAETAVASDRAERWHASIQTVRGGLAGMIAKLEETRGEVVAQKPAIDENSNAWERNTQSRLRAAQAAADAAKAAKDEADWIKRRNDIEFEAEANLEKLWAQYQSVVSKASHDTVQAQIDDAWRAADAQVAAINKTGMLTSQMYDLIYRTAAATVDGIKQKTLEMDQYTRSHYALLATEAQQAYDRALASAEEYTPKRIQLLRDEAEAAQITLQNWQEAADKALTKTGDTADTTRDKIKKISDEFERARDVITQGFGAQNSEVVSAGSGRAFGSVVAGIPGVPASVAAGLFPSLPGIYAGGVAGALQFASGQNQYAPVRDITVTMNYPIANDPQALNQLARTVGDAIMSGVTRTGQRV